LPHRSPSPSIERTKGGKEGEEGKGEGGKREKGGEVEMEE